jgi:hypothetical protein
MITFGIWSARVSDDNISNWCERCGCGNDVAGYAHLPTCPTLDDDERTVNDTSQTTRSQKLEAVARLAIEGWERWEKMGERQDAYRKNGTPLPSWPRDEFESWLDALKTDAEEALRE